MFHGLIDIPVWMIVLVTLGLTHITIIGVTVFLHRHQAHRALTMHPAVSHFFRLWMWLTTGMVTKEWVAVHRKHHAKVETKDDPHSPQIVGLNKVLWTGAVLYRQETKKQATVDEYGHGTPDDWVERNVYTPHSTTGIVTMLLIDVLLFGLIAGPIVWGVQMIWIPFFAAGVINGVGHWSGYRNFNTPDTSTNIVPWGILIGGEELHNNHHAYASSAKFSTRKWEFDVSWYYILLLQKLGLAEVKKVAPKPQTNPSKGSVDLDTLRAIFTHRFQILTNYGKNVVQPILKKEIFAGEKKHVLKRNRRLLMRDENLLDSESKQHLQNVLDRSELLLTVYRFKLNLQKLWHRSTQSQEQLLQSLQEWCQQAEKTGIKALQDFALSLRSYSMLPAANTP